MSSLAVKEDGDASIISVIPVVMDKTYFIFFHLRQSPGQVLLIVLHYHYNHDHDHDHKCHHCHQQQTSLSSLHKHHYHAKSNMCEQMSKLFSVWHLAAYSTATTCMYLQKMDIINMAS